MQYNIIFRNTHGSQQISVNVAYEDLTQIEYIQNVNELKHKNLYLYECHKYFNRGYNLT